MATVYLSPISLIIQYLTSLGAVAAGGQVFTYKGGTVNTLQDTYSDSTGLVKNPNPLTLNSAGRPVSASGVPIAFWTLPGLLTKLVVNDAGGNLLWQEDNIPALNDLTNATNALQALLANAASANSSGFGPVGGADYVANAVKSYDVFATVRAANIPTLTPGQTLNIDVQGATSVGDNLGGRFYWSTTSTATDDNRTVLRPNIVVPAAPGRYIRLLGLGEAIVIEKPTDQQVTNSTVLTADTALGVTLAPGVYLIANRLNLLGNGGTGGGWKVLPIFTGTATGMLTGVGVSSSNGTPSALYVNFSAAVTAAAVSSTNGDCVNFDMILTVTASGGYSITWAQNSASANGLVMKAGSCLIVTRLA